VRVFAQLGLTLSWEILLNGNILKPWQLNATVPLIQTGFVEGKLFPLPDDWKKTFHVTRIASWRFGLFLSASPLPRWFPFVVYP